MGFQADFPGSGGLESAKRLLRSDASMERSWKGLNEIFQSHHKLVCAL